MTPWFPADSKPVRVGVYEVESVILPGFCVGYARFDSRWYCFEQTPQRAAKVTVPVRYGHRRWRGLTKP